MNKKQIVRQLHKIANLAEDYGGLLKEIYKLADELEEEAEECEHDFKPSFFRGLPALKCKKCDAVEGVPTEKEQTPEKIEPLDGVGLYMERYTNGRRFASVDADDLDDFVDKQEEIIDVINREL